ncbi:MAG TPA: type VI secretion system accessory protein TagJ [Gemmatimonadaceae bacterium]|nr:type VI secretion system accessory protein TagJ [Gemmatimonadaceae bacterium]
MTAPPHTKARALFDAGALDAAIEALGVDLRSNPTDAQRRTFLFELLCFAGSWSRAEKQLEVLRPAGPQAELGVALYRSALHAEQTRQAMFETGDLPRTSVTDAVAGTINGTPFSSIRDADPRIGARLELFAAGRYLWVPFEHIASIRMEPPRRLRDLLWIPAVVHTGPGIRGLELGEVMLPVLAPLTWKHASEAVRLGRITEWSELEDGSAAPVGQKLLLVDDEEVPILELRELEITAAPPVAS